MSLTIERTVLTQLVSNEEYTRKVLPFLKGDYFSDKSERIVFEEITKFVEKYNKIPTKTSLEIEVQSRKDLNESDFKNVISLVNSLQNDENVNFDWLVDTISYSNFNVKSFSIYSSGGSGIVILPYLYTTPSNRPPRIPMHCQLSLLSVTKTYRSLMLDI